MKQHQWQESTAVKEEQQQAAQLLLTSLKSFAASEFPRRRAKVISSSCPSAKSNAFHTQERSEPAFGLSTMRESATWLQITWSAANRSIDRYIDRVGGGGKGVSSDSLLVLVIVKPFQKVTINITTKYYTSLLI